MKITSSAFEDNQPIPEQYTCDGQDINPPLQFEDVPDGTATLALILFDPDAPSRTFYHWVLFNIDPNTDYIDEDSMPVSVIEGTNDSGTTEYSGPCPTAGTHRYIFTLYALDGPLNLEKGVTAKKVLEETEGRIVDIAKLVGLYSRKE